MFAIIFWCWSLKWGFRNFVRTAASGIIYGFFLYSGSSDNGEKCTGKYSVLKLIEILPLHENFSVYFGYWLCSLPLCFHLKEIGFMVTTTIRTDRAKKMSLTSWKGFADRRKRQPWMQHFFEFRCVYNEMFWQQKCPIMCYTL